MSGYEHESLAAEAKLAAEKKQRKVENLSKRPGERKNGQ
jgi:hypothetical protein